MGSVGGWRSLRAYSTRRRASWPVARPRILTAESDVEEEKPQPHQPQEQLRETVPAPFCARNAAKHSTYRLHRDINDGSTLRTGIGPFFVLVYNGCNTVGIMQSAPQMGIRTPETSVLAGTPVCIMWRSTMQPSGEKIVYFKVLRMPAKKPDKEK